MRESAVVPSFPLPRFLETEIDRREHARKLERVVRESGGNVGELKTAHTAADARSLRGVPCVAKSVPGVVLGTQPELATVAKLSR